MTVGPEPHPARGRRRAVRTVAFVLVLGAVLATTFAVWRSDGARPLRPRLVATGTAATADSSATTTTSAGPATSTPTTAAPSLRAPSPAQPLDVFFTGDSTAYAIGESLGSLDTAGLLAVDVHLVTSSGLARPDFFDWPAFLRSAQEAQPAEVVILSIGANDLQPLTDPGGTVHTDVHGEAWGAEYLRRVEEVSRTVTAAGTRVYWVGQPIARDPAFTAGMRRINGLLRTAAERNDDVAFVDTFGLLAGDDFTYVDTRPGPDGVERVVRRPDGIHLTLDGGAVIGQAVADRLRRDWGDEPGR